MLQRLRHHRIEPKELKFLNGPMYSFLGGGSMMSYATLIVMAKEQGKILTMLDPHFLAPPSASSVSAEKTKAQKQQQKEQQQQQQCGLVTVAPKIFSVGWDSDIHRFTAPLWLAALDDEIVVRSAGLLGYPAFRYVEAQTYSPHGLVDLCGSLSLGCMLVLCAHPLAADQVTTARQWAQPIHSGARMGKDVLSGQG